MDKSILSNLFEMPDNMRHVSNCLCGKKVYGYVNESGAVKLYKDKNGVEMKQCPLCHDDLNKRNDPDYKKMVEVSRRELNQGDNIYEVDNVINF